jgi:putative Mn2+ efflux pump MntP
MRFRMHRITLKDLNKNKCYKVLTKGILLLYIVLMLVYVFRDVLYALNNPYITIFAWTAPNLIPSFLFTIIGTFYILPTLLNEKKSYKHPKYLWIVNVLNLVLFSSIELMHVIFDLGVWDNKDIMATIIGIVLATLSYYKIRNYL